MDEREQQTADTQSLQEQAYLALRRAIIFAQYKPGERLVPKQICEELNLGRTPVRESLVRLQQQGLVRTVPQSGTYVSRIDSHAAECSRFAREHLEQQVAIECCARIDDAGIALLDETIAQQEQAVADHDQRAFYESDNRMHELLFRLAGRERIWDWLDLTNTHFERFRWLSVLTNGVDWNVVIDQHRQIRNAIVARDTNEVSYLVTRHLHKALGDRETVVAAHPEYFEEA